MKMKGLQYDAGEDIRVQRTEIQNLPPYPFFLNTAGIFIKDEDLYIY